VPLSPTYKTDCSSWWITCSWNRYPPRSGATPPVIRSRGRSPTGSARDPICASKTAAGDGSVGAATEVALLSPCASLRMTLLPRPPGATVLESVPAAPHPTGRSTQSRRFSSVSRISRRPLPKVKKWMQEVRRRALTAAAGILQEPNPPSRQPLKMQPWDRVIAKAGIACENETLRVICEERKQRERCDARRLCCAIDALRSWPPTCA
jgi:hypothetical protein